MIKKETRHSRSVPASPWIIVCSAAILLVVVLVMATRTYNREKEYMAQILLEKGAVLIKAMEAGARTGMRGMMGGGRQVQTLLEETAVLPDVLYLEIYSKEGVVLASSDGERVGSQQNHRLYLDRLKVPGDPGWMVVESETGETAFVAYQYFKPVFGRSSGRMRQMTHKAEDSNSGEPDWCTPTGTAESEQIIIIGLDPKPFEDARKEDIRNSLVLSGVLVVLALAGFVSLFWMQRYQVTKRSLQDTSAFADEIVTSLPVGLIATDKDGNIAFFNDAAEKITGLDLKSARGVDAETVLPSYFCGLKDLLDTGQSISESEMECEFSAGKVVPVSVSASRIINEEGFYVGQVLILKDLGEVRRLQNEIRRKEKLAAVGELAAGVAHEIRNPLSSIKGIATYFKDKFENQPEDTEAAGVMIQEVDRLNRVISELLEFARPAQLQMKKTDIAALLLDSVRLVRPDAASQGIDIDISETSEPLMADIDADRLSQCLLNLYLNAIQAMKTGGKLSIGASRRNGHIAIEIRDTGSGIPAADLSKIFDPYYTTKPKGTGLGLAIVHKIMEAHNGRVKVRSISGEGTIVTLSFPSANTS